MPWNRVIAKLPDKMEGDFVLDPSIERRIKRLKGLIAGLESTMKATRYCIGRWPKDNFLRVAIRQDEGRLLEYRAELAELEGLA